MLVFTENFGERTVVYADPKQIKQVFLNFFLNALEAMVNDGELSISINNDSTDYDLKARRGCLRDNERK